MKLAKILNFLALLGLVFHFNFILDLTTPIRNNQIILFKNCGFIQKLLAIIYKGQQEVQTHLFGYSCQILVFKVKVKAIYRQDGWFVGQKVKICQKLHQRLIVFDIFQLDLPQSFNLYFAVYSKEHILFNHVSF